MKEILTFVECCVLLSINEEALWELMTRERRALPFSIIFKVTKVKAEHVRFLTSSVIEWVKREEKWRGWDGETSGGTLHK
jgi:predicted DNA-binding transcriptional regulator AlpA